MAKLVKCAVCDNIVSIDAKSCPHCGAVSFRKRGIVEDYRYLAIKITGTCSMCNGSGVQRVESSHLARVDGYLTSVPHTKQQICHGCGGFGQTAWSKVIRPNGETFEQDFGFGPWSEFKYQVDCHGKKSISQPYVGYVVYKEDYID